MYYYKNINGEYDTIVSMNNAINYIFKDKSISGRKNFHSYGFGVYDLNHTLEEFLLVKNYFNQLSGKLIKHFSISFATKDYFTGFDADEFASHVCVYFCMRYQIVYSVHTDTQHLHIHFVVNTTSFVDGKRLDESYEEYSKFRRYLNQCYRIAKTKSNAILKMFRQQEREAWGEP